MCQEKCPCALNSCVGGIRVGEESDIVVMLYVCVTLVWPYIEVSSVKAFQWGCGFGVPPVFPLSTWHAQRPHPYATAHLQHPYTRAPCRNPHTKHEPCQPPDQPPNQLTNHQPPNYPTAQVWLAPLRAVVPGTGYVVYWHALWQEQAAGITLHALAQVRARLSNVLLLDVCFLNVHSSNVHVSDVHLADVYVERGLICTRWRRWGEGHVQYVICVLGCFQGTRKGDAVWCCGCGMAAFDVGAIRDVGGCSRRCLRGTRRARRPSGLYPA